MTPNDGRLRPPVSRNSDADCFNRVPAVRGPGMKAVMAGLLWFLTLVAVCVRITSVSAQQAAARFDRLVREDMFAGLEGDDAALERAMALCETRLGQDPQDAEALVWHGTGLLVRAGAAFAAGGRDSGIRLSAQAMAEMGRAVALRPDDVSVLIPRATALLGAAARMTSAQPRRNYLRMAVGDFEKVLVLQQSYFDRLPAHPKGELLGGLAESWLLLGEPEKAQIYLWRMVGELPETAYAASAKARIADPGGGPPITCLGCHRGK
jgi:hypothetical protein